jgi:hypothetical protein
MRTKSARGFAFKEPPRRDAADRVLDIQEDEKNEDPAYNPLYRKVPARTG